MEGMGRAEQRGIGVSGQGSIHFTLYVQHVGETVKSKSAVQEAVNAIGWVHQLLGLPPCSCCMSRHLCMLHSRDCSGNWPIRLR